MIFVDGSNLYHGLKSETGDTRVDFLRLGRKLAADDELHTTHYYNAPLIEKLNVQAYRAQQQFLEALKRTDGVILRLGRMQLTATGVLVEKGVDVLLAIDMLRHVYQNDYDTAILVSGDGDFAPLVAAVTGLGKRVKNVAFHSARSDALVDVCHTFIELTPDFLQDCRP